MPYVYILECADGTLYTGWTKDLARRVREHNQGHGARYTSSRRPVRLVYWEDLPTQRAAMQRELVLKRLNRRGRLALVERWQERHGPVGPASDDAGRVRVDLAQCQLVGERLSAVQVPPDPALRTPRDVAERQHWANLLFYVVAICQHTVSLVGELDGTWYRGWDYLIQAAWRAEDREPGYFAADRMAGYTVTDLQALFSDTGDLATSTLDRLDERVGQLHDCACRLLADYGGQAMNLYQAAGGMARGAGGLYERLAQFDAYADPVEKKSTLLLAFLNQAGIWPLTDPHNITMAVDYHAMRVALRSGIVAVPDPALARTLRERAPVDPATNTAVRAAVREACAELARQSGHSIYNLDRIIWLLGRSCCFYDHEPICGTRACFKAQECTFVTGVTYSCPGHCVLDGICPGSVDPAYRAFWETNVYTTHY
ncbi:MAG: GIY-YIG nuclease family protein [Chloroflexi bacterium]|nr:GIY-YIG nuclease family protein [Chloroflexota bacterium]MBU1750107.1 GIY-YIG nuclease family protein [Chloroflexota bacterium]